MKLLAIFIAILAILISVVPQFTDCESQGRTLTLEDGHQISMKCHWTARAELVAGIPLFAIGAMTYFSRRKETRIVMGVLGSLLGVLVILLPTGLIGVCMNAEMLCNSVMKPFLILTGSLVVAVSLAVIVFSILGGDNDPTTQVKPA
jgi:hypothetical protein